MIALISAGCCEGGIPYIFNYTYTESYVHHYLGPCTTCENKNLNWYSYTHTATFTFNFVSSLDKCRSLNFDIVLSFLSDSSPDLFLSAPPDSSFTETYEKILEFPRDVSLSAELLGNYVIYRDWTIEERN